MGCPIRKFIVAVSDKHRFLIDLLRDGRIPAISRSNPDNVWHIQRDDLVALERLIFIYAARDEDILHEVLPRLEAHLNTSIYVKTKWREYASSSTPPLTQLGDDSNGGVDDATTPPHHKHIDPSFIHETEEYTLPDSVLEGLRRDITLVQVSKNQARAAFADLLQSSSRLVDSQTAMMFAALDKLDPTHSHIDPTPFFSELLNYNATPAEMEPAHLDNLNISPKPSHPPDAVPSHSFAPIPIPVIVPSIVHPLNDIDFVAHNLGVKRLSLPKDEDNVQLAANILTQMQDVYRSALSVAKPSSSISPPPHSSIIELLQVLSESSNAKLRIPLTTNDDDGPMSLDATLHQLVDPLIKK